MIVASVADRQMFTNDFGHETTITGTNFQNPVIQLHGELFNSPAIHQPIIHIHALSHANATLSMWRTQLRGYLLKFFISHDSDRFINRKGRVMKSRSVMAAQ
ncbi:hypothetical protein [Spirosoma arcticum]